MYRSRDVLRRRQLVHEALAPRKGERILDVGCGPGFYVAELLDELGPDGSVVGIDVAPAMLAVARDRVAGRENVELIESDATSLQVADDDFDAALSVQVFEYVEDVDAALGEVRRALRPGGRIVLWDVDWATLSMHSEDRDRMNRVLRGWDAHLADASLPRTLAPRMRAAGFEQVAMQAHVFATTEMTPEAYGGSLVPLIKQYVIDNATVAEDEAHAWEAEQAELDERGEFYFAVTQFCFTAIASSSSS
jgi:SAM-dependent methyltransferase